jgi:hypothetical protein
MVDRSGPNKEIDVKELAKFFCGWEACHGAFHAYFWAAGIEFTALGMHFTTGRNAVTALVDIVIAVALGIYAWRRRAT